MKKRKRPRLLTEFRNIRTLPSGYQATLTRNKKEYSKHFAGHSAKSLQAAERWRDEMLRLMPDKRKNLVPRRVLTALGLKKPVVGVAYNPQRSFFQVSYRGSNGRFRSRSFKWANRSEEVVAYAAAARFRKSLFKQLKR